MIRSATLLALSLCAGAASSQYILPADFENTTTLDRLFAFGGVTSFQTAHSSQLVYEQVSLQLNIAFTGASSLNFSNVGLGVLNTGTAGFQLEPMPTSSALRLWLPSRFRAGWSL